MSNRLDAPAPARPLAGEGAPAAQPRHAAAFPALFVMLWSTGFIAAKFGLPYAPPLSFLAVRFALVATLMALVAFATRATWPQRPREFLDLAIVAALVHGAYLGGVFMSLKAGMAAGTSAMLVGLQPLLTVLLARAWLGERVLPRQWLGLVIGLVGVFLVVRHKVSFGGGAGGLLPSAVALVGISVGTLYQKRHCAHIDLRSGAVVQFSACTVLFVPLVFVFEPEPIRWAPTFVFALSWSVLVLSVGAISLLYWLLRHGAAANVARLFYLVPPVTALLAFALFGETLDAVALAGMALIAAGVALAAGQRPAIGSRRDLRPPPG